MRIANILIIKILIVSKIGNRGKNKIDFEKDKALNVENHD